MRRHLFAPILCVLSLTLLLAACGPGANTLGRPQSMVGEIDPAIQTGNYKKIEVKSGDVTRSQAVPYTIAGQKQIFENLRTEMAGTSDMMLAKAVQNVTVVLKNEKGERIDKKPATADVNIQFKKTFAGVPDQLNFVIPLLYSGNNLTAKNVLQNDHAGQQYPYKMDVNCHDLDCRVMELRLKKFARDDNKNPTHLLRQVGILYRTTYPTVRIQRDKTNQDFKSPALQNLEKTTKDKTAIRSSVVVVDGPAFSKIEVPGALNVETDLLDTGDTSVSVNDLKVQRPDTTIEKMDGELVGNDPNSGSLILDLNNPETQENARLYIEDTDDATGVTKKDEPQKPYTALPTAKPDGKQIFKVLQDAKNFPNTVRVSHIFDEYMKDPETQRMIRVWLGQEKNKGCRAGDFGPNELEAFFTYMPNVAPYVDKIGALYDVTPEIGYLVLIESHYAKSPNYPTAEVGPGKTTTSLGPWQINDGTAEDIRKMSKIPFKNFKVVGRKPDLRDDRTFFLNSTLMATTLLQKHFSTFSDPAMAIFAYHGGAGSARSAIRNTEKYERYDISLQDVLKYRVQTSANCTYINYAYAFLAARAIGQNLDFYGAGDIKPATSNTNYKKRLKNPNGTIPGGIL